MRRILRATLLVTASCLLALLGFGMTAGPSTAASPTPYPPPTCASISVSSTVVSPGEAITVQGAGFVAGSTVHILFHSAPTTLATVTADSSGKFSVSVKMPLDAVGNHTISADGPAVGCPADPIQIVVQTGPTTSPTTPAVTGVDILLLVATAGVFLIAGLMLTRGGRRRQSTQA